MNVVVPSATVWIESKGPEQPLSERSTAVAKREPVAADQLRLFELGPEVACNAVGAPGELPESG